jgi:hypothetical protein
VRPGETAAPPWLAEVRRERDAPRELRFLKGLLLRNLRSEAVRPLKPFGRGIARLQVNLEMGVRSKKPEAETLREGNDREGLLVWDEGSHRRYKTLAASESREKGGSGKPWNRKSRSRG